MDFLHAKRIVNNKKVFAQHWWDCCFRSKGIFSITELRKRFKLKGNLVGLVGIEINLVRFSLYRIKILLAEHPHQPHCFWFCFVYLFAFWKRNDDAGERIGRLCNFGKIEFRSQNRNCHGKSKINGNRWFYLSFLQSMLPLPAAMFGINLGRRQDFTISSIKSQIEYSSPITLQSKILST